jgi:PPM family protein phosphatase
MTTVIKPVTGNATDTGKERSDNQDYFGFYDDTPYGMLWLVCDGMGGAAGGRTASTMAVECIRETFYASGWQTVPEVMRAAAARANEVVYNRGQEDVALRGMGTTLAMIVLQDNRFYFGHIGDSRIYRIHEMQMEQLTRDHTLVQKMLEEGAIKPEQVAGHPQAHVITRSLGVAPEVELDIEEEPIDMVLGDCYIICSDGLSGMVQEEIVQEFVLTFNPQDACQKLVDVANKNGGLDNITVQILQVQEVEEKISVIKRMGPVVRRYASNRKVLALLGVGVICNALLVGGLWWWLNAEAAEPKSLNNAKTDIEIISAKELESGDGIDGLDAESGNEESDATEDIDEGSSSESENEKDAAESAGAKVENQ